VGDCYPALAGTWPGTRITSEATMEAIPDGAEVVDKEGERLGNVIASAANYIVAEQGLFFPTNYYIPRNVIAEVSDAIVRLTMTKADVLDQGWGVEPEAPTSSSSVIPENETQ
jgi:hypothetical protein